MGRELWSVDEDVAPWSLEGEDEGLDVISQVELDLARSANDGVERGG